jgi:alanine-glyoxylate transaminase/serine-glyoxylate transaminase/serine-pyruvate transaminase
MGTLAGVEMGLRIAGVPAKSGGVEAAMAFLADSKELQAQGLLPKQAAA